MREFIAIIAGIVMAAAPARAAQGLEKLAPAVYQRTVFLGDSITDGDTYPRLVQAAIKEAGLAPMIAINAGIGGDTARGMHARLERDVLAHHPTLVTFSAGANDAAHGVTAEAYEVEVRGILDRLKKEQIPVILLTPSVTGPKFKPRVSVEVYEAVLRRLAGEYHLRVAEVNQRQREAEPMRHQLAPDDLHPNWEGQMSIARAVLDAMGYGQVKVPETIPNQFRPGLISPWKVKRLDPKAKDLTEQAVAQLEPAADWLTLTLPETEPMKDLASYDRWYDGYRAQGASVALLKGGPGKYVGLATIRSDGPRRVQFVTGAELNKIWLNGTVIYENTVRRGYHIGRQSVAGELRAGENRVVIQMGPVFFLGVGEE